MPVDRTHPQGSLGKDSAMFAGLLISKTDDGQKVELSQLDESQLPEGDVLIDVEYSTLNYKDGLAITGRSPVVRKWPMVPGIDLAGTVKESGSSEWKPGDKVVLNGWGVGETHWGGLAQKARLKGEWLVPLPKSMTSRQAMAIGTAGYTAALCVEALARPLIGVGRTPKISRAEAEALIVDCTEQPIQRPGTDAVQREHYSGKKKRHTLKTEYVVTGKGRIVAASASHPGSHHDLTIRRKGPPLPKRARAYVDSGYQGYDKDHANLEFPYKKPKRGELNDEEKEYNRGLSSFRVRVEHRIGRVKRFRIVSERFRNPLRTHDTKVSIVAGLVNLEDGFGPF